MIALYKEDDPQMKWFLYSTDWPEKTTGNMSLMSLSQDADLEVCRMVVAAAVCCCCSRDAGISHDAVDYGLKCCCVSYSDEWSNVFARMSSVHQSAVFLYCVARVSRN